VFSPLIGWNVWGWVGVGVGNCVGIAPIFRGVYDSLIFKTGVYGSFSLLYIRLSIELPSSTSLLLIYKLYLRIVLPFYY
jgi:hypothetical protein